MLFLYGDWVGDVRSAHEDAGSCHSWTAPGNRGANLMGRGAISITDPMLADQYSSHVYLVDPSGIAAAAWRVARSDGYPPELPRCTLKYVH